MGYVYILSTVLLTVYGQIILKWRISLKGGFPVSGIGKFHYFVHLLLDPWVVSSLFAAFIAALCWMAALTKFEVSYAYPFTSLGFVLVLIFGTLMLGEVMTFAKVLGVILIIAGIIVSSR